MHQDLIKYCSQFIDIGELEEDLFIKKFHPAIIKRKAFLLEEGKVCNFIAFVNSGIIRHFHLKNGNEITCDITLPHSFITDFNSFTQSIPSTFYFQALKDVEVLSISKKDLLYLYETNKNFETLGRLMAEKVAQRSINIALSLASDKPEERYRNLIKNQPELIQLVPQKYLANLLGISPESLSRIRSRK